MAGGGDSVGGGLAVGGIGVSVGGSGVEVGGGVTVGGGVGVSVSIGGMVAVAVLGEGLLAIGLAVWMATGRRVGRRVGVGSSDVLSRANHKVMPEPKTTKAAPTHSPINTIAPRAKISLCCFLFNLVTSRKIYGLGLTQLAVSVKLGQS